MLPFAEMPPLDRERVVCSVQAAREYAIPPQLMLAVVHQEGGRPGQRVRNTNGTEDVGALQFNTSYLAELKRHDIREADVAASGCYPYRLAAWRIKGHLVRDKGSAWHRAANYHSRTPKFNRRYAEQLRKRAAKWLAWLGSNGSGGVGQQDVRDRALRSVRVLEP